MPATGTVFFGTILSEFGFRDSEFPAKPRPRSLRGQGFDFRIGRRLAFRRFLRPRISQRDDAVEHGFARGGIFVETGIGQALELVALLRLGWRQESPPHSGEGG